MARPAGLKSGDATGLASGDAIIGLAIGEADATGDGTHVGTTVCSMLGPTGDASTTGIGLAAVVTTGETSIETTGLVTAVTAVIGVAGSTAVLTGDATIGDASTTGL